MRGTKRKIAMDQRRETREQRSVSFTKRRQGLYSKAAELCLLGGARVAIVVSSPCSGRNLYSFGHSSVDAVFDAFLEGRLPEDAGDGGVAKSALSLYQEIKALERQPNERIKKSESDEFWREIEILEKNCDSVEELQDLVDHLEKLQEKASTMMITSDLPSSLNLFNPAENCSSDVVDFGAVTEYNPPIHGRFNNLQDVTYDNVDENCTLSVYDYINFDENYVGDEYNNLDEQADFGMATDSTRHILNTFTMDYEAESVLAGCM